MNDGSSEVLTTMQYTFSPALSVATAATEWKIDWRENAT